MSYYMEIAHATEEEFTKDVAHFLSKVEIKGIVVAIHNEDGEFSYLVPDWMMKRFLKEKINEPPPRPPGSIVVPLD